MLCCPLRPVSGLAQLSVGGVGFRELSPNLHGGVAAARLGMRLAVEESELFQVRSGQFCLGFGGFPILGDSLPNSEFKGQTSPLLFSTSMSQKVFHSVKPNF